MPDQISIIAQNLYHVAAGRCADYQAARKRDTVTWLIRKDSWYSVRQCSVVLYSAGCIRFTNRLARDIPKRIWALPQPTLEQIGTMEITVHESEIEGLTPFILEVAEDPTHDYKNALFPDNLVSPSYAWTTRASAHYESLRKPTRPIRR